MPKKLLLSVMSLASMLAASSYFSPHWTVYRMRAAIAERDYQSFAAHVDFPALRGSFKSQLAGAAGLSRESSGTLEALGRQLAGALAAPMLEAIVRPAGLIEMLCAGRPDISRAVMTSAVTQVPAAAAPEMRIDYSGWNMVRFRGQGMPEADGSFVLVRKGWWSWRLAGVEMPIRFP